MNVVESVIGDTASQLPGEIEALLSCLGQGLTLSVPYDTAWLARLSLKYPGGGFDLAYPWLRAKQRADGSWGADILHYHDRIVCTLAAIIALKTGSASARNSAAIDAGLRYLRSAIQRTLSDQHDT